MELAEEKYAEAFAHEIAAALADLPAGRTVRIEVYHDRAAEAPAVRVRVNRARYELMMPAPGACFALFRNGAWLGGMHRRLGETTPQQVARILLARIEAT